MRVPFLIRFARLLSFTTALAGLLFPALLVAQTAEKALQYQIGETARETIIATETIRIKKSETQPDAPAEVQANMPPVYGYTSQATTDAVAKLTSDWRSTQEQFLDSLERVYGKRTFRTVETTSQTFTEFVDSFQAANSGFPFQESLARSWATDNSNDNELAAHIERLKTFMTAYFIRPDEAPELNDTTITQLDLITVKTPEPTTAEELKNYPTAKISPRQFIPVTQAREIFLRQSDIQNRKLKTYLSQYILPNTHYLETASIDRRNQSQSSLKGEIIFESGDIIVRQGEEITPVIKEALDLMIVGMRFNRIKDSVKIELARESGFIPAETSTQEKKPEKTSPIQETPVKEPEEKTIDEKPEGKLPPILSPTTVAGAEQAPKPSSDKAGLDSEPTPTKSSGGLISSFYLWLLGLVVLTLAGFFIVLHFKKSPPVYTLSHEKPDAMDEHKQSLVKALTSQLTQTLFSQRQALLKSKEAATAQVAAMENRLAKLQPEIFDKLLAYEEKIKHLEERLKQENAADLTSLNKPLLDEDSNEPSPIFVELEGSVEGEENYQSQGSTDPMEEEDKEVPFPGHPISNDLEEDVPDELMDEVLEDLEAEDTFDKRIAKGGSD